MGKYLVNPAANNEAASSSSSVVPEKSASSNNNSMYDLCAVINHLGQSISMGHYTAFARTHDKQNTAKSEVGWRYCDDQRVVPVDFDQHVLTKDAYVLMYRLRSEEANTSPAALATPVSAAILTTAEACKVQVTEAKAPVLVTTAAKTENDRGSSDFEAVAAHRVASLVARSSQGSDMADEPNEEFFDLEDSDESAQLIDDEGDDARDEAIDLSGNERDDESTTSVDDEKMVMSVNNSVLTHDFTNLDETD
jgi:hypothetical protein